MLGNVQNNHKITINILGGSDYFISKQASKHILVVSQSQESSCVDFFNFPFRNRHKNVPERDICVCF